MTARGGRILRDLTCGRRRAARLPALAATLLAVLAAGLTPGAARSAPMWEPGELSYADGNAELAAFVNLPAGGQLQTVLCAKNGARPYRFTLLLPRAVPGPSVLQAQVALDSYQGSVYAEINGNALDFALGEEVLSSLPDTSYLIVTFADADARRLGLPSEIKVPLTAADLTVRRVASECAPLCLGGQLQCQKSLLAAVLWPRDHFRELRDVAVDRACTAVRGKKRHFTLTPTCKLMLDDFYRRAGVGPLSFIRELFTAADGPYARYVTAWNEAAALAAGGEAPPGATADGTEWYLLLYDLAGDFEVTEYPRSYHEIRSTPGDPTTLLYDVDSRYELERLKYTAVLMRRLSGSLQAGEAVERAVKAWAEFYRELVVTMPSFKRVQAWRAVIYRQMLMRIWRLAGQPQGIRLRPEYAFTPGRDGRPAGGEYLERSCALFDGINGEEFFYATRECVRGVAAGLRGHNLATPALDGVTARWDEFAAQWQRSPFYGDAVDDAVGEHPRSNLNLALLSLFKIYGFGDYFLLRECLVTRDADICGYEAQRNDEAYAQELGNRVRSLESVSPADARELSRLSALWRGYADALGAYVDELRDRGLIPAWRADFVKGVAFAVQTNALLNLNYDREELLDDDPVWQD